MRAMMFDVVKLGTQAFLWYPKGPGQIVFQIVHPGSIAQSIPDLPENTRPMPITFRLRKRFHLNNCRSIFLLTVQCPLPTLRLLPAASYTLTPFIRASLCSSLFALCSPLLCRARGRKQNLLVQVRRRIARDADLIHVLDADSGSVQTIAHRLRRKTGA